MVKMQYAEAYIEYDSQGQVVKIGAAIPIFITPEKGHRRFLMMITDNQIRVVEYHDHGSRDLAVVDL